MRFLYRFLLFNLGSIINTSATTIITLHHSEFIVTQEENRKLRNEISDLTLKSKLEMKTVEKTLMSQFCNIVDCNENRAIKLCPHQCFTGKQLS